MCLGIGIVTTGEVTIIRCHNGVLISLVDVFPEWQVQL